MMTAVRGSAVCVLAIAGVCLAETTADHARRSSAPVALRQSPSASPAFITGDVRLAGPEGSVVPSVDVWAFDPENSVEVSRDQTDLDGRFMLSAPPGRYAVSAVRPGFLKSSYGSPHYGLPGSPLVLTAGQRLEIQLIIHRGAVVTGVVRDEKGNPVRSAFVEFLRPPIPGHASEDRSVIEATTGTDGVYRAYGLPPGEYLAVAMVTGRPTGSSDSAVRVNDLAAQFFPGTASESLATPLVLNANEDRTGIDFALRYLPLTSLAGSLIPPKNIKLLDDFVIVVTGIDGTPPIMETPRILAGGGFVVLLHTGRYRVDIRAFGAPADGPPLGPGRLFYSSAVVDVEDTVSLKRDFPLREGLRVSGHVRGIGMQPRGVRVRFSPAAGRRPAIRPVEAATTEDGRFSAEGMAPGRYVIDLVGESSLVLDSVHFRGHVQTGLAIDVDDSVTADELELAVTPSTASLTGHVTGTGDAASSYVLVLLSAVESTQTRSRSVDVHLTRADSTGEYVFSNRKAGSYLLIVLKDLDARDLENRAFLESLRRHSAAVAVTLKANTDTRLDLRVGGTS